jgi:hypothetical protein
MSHDEIIEKHKKLFVGFKSYDVIKKFDVLIKENVKTFMDLFDIPKEYPKSMVNIKKYIFYYKIRGYSLDESIEIISKNKSAAKTPPHKIEYWIDRGFEPNFSKTMVFEYWENWGIILRKFPRCISNKQHYISRGWGEIEAEAKAEFRKNNNRIGVLNSKKAQDRRLKNENQFSVEYWMERGYSTEEAKIKVDERKSKNRSPATTSYWKEKGYSEEESIIKVSEFQRNASVRMWQVSRENDTAWKISKKSIRYFVENGYSIEDATKIIAEKQTTFSKKICIEKHGEEIGLEIWKNRQEKWQNTLNSKPEEEKRKINAKKSNGTMEWALRKSNGDEELAKNILKELSVKKDVYSWDALMRKTGGDVEEAKKLREAHLFRILNNNGKYYSKESIVVLNPIYEHIKSKMPDATILWKDYEYFIRYNNRFYMYDFTIKEIKVIIEYHGKYWHPREGETSWKNIAKTYDDAIKTDRLKEKLARDKEYSYYVIWSDDDIQKVSEKIMKDIDEKIENHFGRFV